MKMISKLASASALALLIASPVVAQTALTGLDNLNDRIDDITEDAQDKLDDANDAERFGPLGVVQGWRGSLAFSASSSDGATDTGEISMAGRMTYGTGAWNHFVGVALEYGQTSGTTTDKEFFGTYEANRYFTEKFYAFGLARYEYDAFSTDEHEAFIGFGPGVRVINTPTTTWRVQAGPGVRYVKTAAGVDMTEGSGIISSRFYHKFTDTISLTNDTDVLGSDYGTIASNDLGVNFKMSDVMSTRFSYRTDYDSEAADEFENTLGVALVLGF
ncbi:DUF481 domain-containing protein [Thalassovita taeanensis]|uniref:Putative salt-induced outer membrane protein n=1 Tax=Thalassovita taeanensis TaxID=657014 RepID=A0A1H9HHX3_9RHOB|nr:DUF481 domain-containing protein [Thalassovita taeanensis]SEQ61826.1 putative salt-induced outer membrane protein [Thalassovita taeanensis]